MYGTYCSHVTLHKSMSSKKNCQGTPQNNSFCTVIDSINIKDNNAEKTCTHSKTPDDILCMNHCEFLYNEPHEDQNNLEILF